MQCALQIIGNMSAYNTAIGDTIAVPIIVLFEWSTSIIFILLEKFWQPKKCAGAPGFALNLRSQCYNQRCVTVAIVHIQIRNMYQFFDWLRCQTTGPLVHLLFLCIRVSGRRVRLIGHLSHQQHISSARLCKRLMQIYAAHWVRMVITRIEYGCLGFFRMVMCCASKHSNAFTKFAWLSGKLLLAHFGKLLLAQRLCSW